MKTAVPRGVFMSVDQTTSSLDSATSLSLEGRDEKKNVQNETDACLLGTPWYVFSLDLSTFLAEK